MSHRGVILPLLERAFELTGISVARLQGPSREQPVAYARFAVYLVAHDQHGLSFNMIGKRLGGRDHSSIIHGVARAREMLKESEGFAYLVDELRKVKVELPYWKRAFRVHDRPAIMNVDRPANDNLAA